MSQDPRSFQEILNEILDSKPHPPQSSGAQKEVFSRETAWWTLNTSFSFSRSVSDRYKSPPRPQQPQRAQPPPAQPPRQIDLATAPEGLRNSAKLFFELTAQPWQDRIDLISLKKLYRQGALKHHPDRQRKTVTDASKEAHGRLFAQLTLCYRELAKALKMD